jgi:hypothetical protein
MAPQARQLFQPQAVGHMARGVAPVELARYSSVGTHQLEAIEGESP